MEQLLPSSGLALGPVARRWPGAELRQIVMSVRIQGMRNRKRFREDAGDEAAAIPPS